MSFLVWNCCGLGNLQGRILVIYSEQKNNSIVFIAKTWVDEARLKEIKRNLLFDGMFLVPRIHKGWGLVMD